MPAIAERTTVRFHPVSAPDYLPVPQLRDLQLDRLQATVSRAFENVKLLRERMRDHGLQPQDIESLDDLSRLPFTVKADLRDTYPYGLFACPLAEIVRLHASSGTTGKPIVVAYTQSDLEVWTSVMVARASPPAACTGATSSRTPTATACSPAASGALRRRSAGRHRHPHLGRQHRAADHGHEGFRRHRHLLHAQLLPAPARARRGNGRRCARAAAARRRLRRRTLDRRHAPAHRRAGPASRPTISTACRKSSGRASASSAAARTACTSSRTTSIPRSSIPRPAQRSRRARKANWCSPR